MFGDGQFLFADVAGQADHVHPVQQWPGDGIQLVGGADEQHFREVHAHIQVVIQELLVLFRVQGLQQGRGRVALVRAADLVDLIQHNHRVGHFTVFQGLHELSGHGADVGATVSLDFGFIPHAAHAETVELPAQGIRHRMADRGFTDPGRADQQQYGAAHFALERAFSQKFNDPVLYIVQAVMVPVQNLAGLGQIKMIL